MGVRALRPWVLTGEVTAAHAAVSGVSLSCLPDPRVTSYARAKWASLLPGNEWTLLFSSPQSCISICPDFTASPRSTSGNLHYLWVTKQPVSINFSKENEVWVDILMEYSEKASAIEVPPSETANCQQPFMQLSCKKLKNKTLKSNFRCTLVLWVEAIKKKKEWMFFPKNEVSFVDESIIAVIGEKTSIVVVDF